MNEPPDFTTGVELTTDNLGALDDAIVAARATLSPGSGLQGWSLPSGVGLRYQKPAEGWFKVTGASSGPGSGNYFELTQQVDQPDGTFSDGPMVRVAAVFPITATPPTGSIVRAWKDRARWLFLWGGCP